MTYTKPFILRSDTRPRVSLLARGRANSAIFALRSDTRPRVSLLARGRANSAIFA